MMNGRNNGKKLKAVRIVAHSFEIVRSTLHVFLIDTKHTNVDPRHDRSKPHPSRR
jgi:ribosomal protein S7